MTFLVTGLWRERDMRRICERVHDDDISIGSRSQANADFSLARRKRTGTVEQDVGIDVKFTSCIHLVEAGPAELG